MVSDFYSVLSLLVFHMLNPPEQPSTQTSPAKSAVWKGFSITQTTSVVQNSLSTESLSTYTCTLINTASILKHVVCGTDGHNSIPPLQGHRGHCLKSDPLECHHCKYEEVRITALESRHVLERDVIHHPMTAARADVRSHSTLGLSCLCFSLYVTPMFSSTDVLSSLRYYCYHYLTCSRLLREADKRGHGQRLKLNSAQMWHWWSGFHTLRNCLYRTSCPGLLKMPCLRRQSPVISYLNNTIGKANSLLGLFISVMREALKPVIMRLCLFA